MKISIFALGGLNELGNNMYIVNVDDDIFIFDCGVKFAYEDMLGVDYIHPDFSYLRKNKRNIKGLFISNIQASQMGGVADLVREIPSLKVYGSRLVTLLLKKDLSSLKLPTNNLIEIKPYKVINFGKQSIFPVSMTSSVPDSLAYALNTPSGYIFYSGDFTFDMGMKGFYKTDLGKLAYIGKQNVLCLMAESFYADQKGYTAPNNRTSSFIHEVFMHNKKRIIALVNMDQIYRIQEIMTECIKSHKTLIIMGHNLQERVDFLLKTGYLKYEESKIGSLNNLDDNNVVVLISDENTKPFANLERIIKGFDKYINLKADDTVFLTAPAELGTEKLRADIMDQIAEMNALVVALPKKYLLHHASTEDLRMIINLINPKYYFSVKGEYKDQVLNSEIALEEGILENHIILKENGGIATFQNGKLLKAKKEEKEQVGTILIDGNRGKEVGDIVIQDREVLGESGIVIVNCLLSKKGKHIISGPDIIAKGFVYIKDNQELLEVAKDKAKSIIENNISSAKNYADYNNIKTEMRKELGNYFAAETGTRPLILIVTTEM